jgi:putative selenium metabolism hydrolase
MPIADEAMIRFLIELVRIQSLSGDEKKAIDRVAREMHGLGYDGIAIDAYGNLSGVVEGNHAGPTLLLDAHVDTVGVAPGIPWQHAPFGAVIQDGRMYGRGTADMKGPLAAMLYAVAAADRSRLRGRVVFSVSVMEEVIEGYLLEPVVSRYSPDMVIIGEPSGMKLIHGSRGRAEILFTATGRPVHSSLPHQGINAVHLMMAAMAAIESRPLPEHPEIGPAILALTDIISEPYPGHSMIPGTCRATYDRRTLPGESAEQILDTWDGLEALACVRADIATARYTTYTGREMVVQKFFPAWYLEKDHRLVTSGLNALKACGIDAATGIWPFNTNATFTAGLKNIPTIGFGPSKEGQAHIVDEYIELDELQTAARGYLAMIESYLG